jgi:hypothetical protein
MATLQQYSEVVAAYGYTLPPPAQPQTNRLGLALLYAAIGAALGTMTGTTMAVVTMQPAAAPWAHHLSLANFTGAVKTAPAAHAISAPVVAHATPAPSVAHAAPAPVPAAPVMAAKAVATPAPAASAPAVVVHASQPGILSRIMPSSVVEASVDTKAVQRELEVHHPAAHARLALAPAVHRNSAVATLDSASKPATPGAEFASIRTLDAVPVPAVVPVNLDEQVRQPAIFFSEGDATVVDFDSTLGSILTDDGRTFVLGATVAMSSATSWNDYRANVHYRCDQGGKCTLTRNGVIALNAKLI